MSVRSQVGGLASKVYPGLDERVWNRQRDRQFPSTRVRNSPPAPSIACTSPRWRKTCTRWCCRPTAHRQSTRETFRSSRRCSRSCRASVALRATASSFSRAASFMPRLVRKCAPADRPSIPACPCSQTHPVLAACPLRARAMMARTSSLRRRRPPSCSLATSLAWAQSTTESFSND